MKKILLFIISVFFLTSFSFCEDEINLPSITTYVSAPVAEQKIVLSEEDIQTEHAQDLPSLLESAGIQLLSYGPYGLESKPSLRGFTDETVRVVIDGVCVNNAQYGTFDFSSISLENIEKIEIIKGGFTEGVSDDDAVGGVIKITTKKQSLGHHLSLDTSVKTFFNQEKPVDTISEKLAYNGQLFENTFANFSVKGTFAQNEYYFVNRDITQIQKNARVLDGNSNLNITNYFGNGNSFSFNDLFYIGDKTCPGPINSTNIGNQKDLNNNFYFTLKNPAVLDLFNLSNTVSYLYNNRKYDDKTGHSNHNLHTVKLSSVIDFYNLKYIEESVSFNADFSHLASTDDGMHNQFSVALKSTTKFQLNDIFALSVPVSFKCCNQNAAFVPKFGVSCKFSSFSILFDVYKMVQFPTMDDLYWDGGGFKGNADLKPENGIGGDLRFSFKNIHFCIFSNYYQNKIQWSGTTVNNISSAFYLGVDFDMEKSFFDERLMLRINAEYLYTQLLDESNKLTYGKKIMWTPDLVASVCAKWQFANGAVALEGNYVGKRYCTNINASFLKPYFLLNLCTDYTFKTKKGHEIIPYLRIDNILNWNYQSVENYSMPGISATVGVKLNFNKKA